MAQHFLLSAQARTLSLRSIFADGEDKAYETFCKLRWPGTNGEPVCPHCGSVEAYKIATRRRFKCVGCGKQYSVTSGTILHSRKMAYVDLLAAICILTNGAKGVSALQLSRDMKCQHKTAFVLAHKLREAMALETKGHTLSGEVEIDGAFFGGHVRPANKAEERIEVRLAQHRSGKRRVVIALRQRKGRTLPFVSTHEGYGVELAKRLVCRLATIHADEASHWDALHGGWDTKRINHSQAYSSEEGCTNQAESYFSRLRRMVNGQHHAVSPDYLYQYANHAAWIEDNRRLDNGALSRAFRPPKDWSNRGQMTRIVLSILRQASEPLTSRDIALELLVQRALDKNDLRLLRLMTKRVGVALRLQKDKGAVHAEQGPGQYVLWELVR